MFSYLVLSGMPLDADEVSASCSSANWSDRLGRRSRARLGHVDAVSLVRRRQVKMLRGVDCDRRAEQSRGQCSAFGHGIFPVSDCNIGVKPLHQ